MAMMKHEFLAQHHYARADLLVELKKLIPGLRGILGTEEGNPWVTYQACLRALIESESDFGVILQDDVVLCRNLEDVIAEIADQKPDCPICLYAPGALRLTVRDLRRADQTGRITPETRFFQVNPQDFFPVVAVMWPKAKAAEAYAWTDGRIYNGRAALSDDAMLGLWMRETNQKVLLTRPSLIDHRNDVPSIVRGGQRITGRARNAFWFIGDQDPLELTWNLA